MKKRFIYCLSLVGLLDFFGISCFTQTYSGDTKFRVYNYPMDPRQHPDDVRRHIKPPDAGTFGNQVQFMAVRYLDDAYRQTLDDYTIKFDLGDVLWPDYPLLFRKDLPEIIQEIKRRNLYVFDIWGYVPGSGPGGYWQAFRVPQKSLELLEKELGDRWLGMDNGEQDGRYVGGFASQLTPLGSNREQQYLNFQNHFQGLTDRLGNKMSTLVSLNFGHYFLKEGIYSLIGAETAQGLPNGQLYYSFIRGAGKQYGVPWFGNASVWNRWGWKNYSGISEYNGGDTGGSSLSLLKRLMYSHIMYDCSFVGFDLSWLNQKNELSPIGKIQQSAVQWIKKYGDPGHMYTPVAVMLDFFSGWSFPRHLYSGNIYRVWGNLPYEDGDYLTDGILHMFYPGYRDASYFHDETGFITPTPYGDAADCILSDSPLWLLKQYPVLVIGGKLQGGYEIRDKLEKYVESGGHLVITAGSLECMPGDLAGLSVGKGEFYLDETASISCQQTEIRESSGFKVREIQFPPSAKTIATGNDQPLVVELRAGSGKITVFASPFGLGTVPLEVPRSSVDSILKTPFPLLNHVQRILGDLFISTEIFSVEDDLSLITCRKGKGEFTVAVCNNSWQERPFRIQSNAGEILQIKELPLDCSEQKSIGFLPKNIVNQTGKNTGKKIAGGDIRIFSIHVDEKNIEDLPGIQTVPNPVNRALNLQNISSIKKEILLRPTFFQYFDRVIVDWKYLAKKEKAIIEEESGWIRRQGLKVVVDFSSGINLFPDLRLVSNDTAEFERSMDAIKNVIDKMALLGSKDLILKIHRMIGNNYTREQFDQSLQKTIRELCRYAYRNGASIHVRMTSGRNALTAGQISELLLSVGEPNLYAAPAISIILSKPDEFQKNLEELKSMKVSMLFVAAPEMDIYNTVWNVNKSCHNYPDKLALRQLLSIHPGSIWVLDGIYGDKDEEYLEIEALENL